MLHSINIKGNWKHGLALWIRWEMINGLELIEELLIVVMEDTTVE